MNFINFYTGKEPDDHGRYLRDILKWPDERLENTHNYIQRIFPLADPSGADPSAPTLNSDDILLIQATIEFEKLYDIHDGVYGNILAIYNRMLAFWSLDKEILSKPYWVYPGSHNYLRITRTLKSLTLFGLTDKASELRGKLKILCEQYLNDISFITKTFWKDEETICRKSSDT